MALMHAFASGASDGHPQFHNLHTNLNRDLMQEQTCHRKLQVLSSIFNLCTVHIYD